MEALFENRILWVTLLAAGLAQLLKWLEVAVSQRRLDFRRLFETGGMPSSHSAAVAALTTGLGMKYGLQSPFFTISIVFAVIVIYDATGIRRAAGEHAEVLNELVEELNHLLRDGFRSQHLKTLLGHTYPQALVGIIIGVVLALIFV
jgi:hypothetical protein